VRGIVLQHQAAALLVVGVPRQPRRRRDVVHGIGHRRQRAAVVQPDALDLVAAVRNALPLTERHGPRGVHGRLAAQRACLGQALACALVDLAHHGGYHFADQPPLLGVESQQDLPRRFLL